MLSGYRDFELGSFQPFLGAGLGIARNTVTDISGTSVGAPNDMFFVPGGTRWGLAWALTAGISIPVKKGIAGELALRYTDLGKVTTDAGHQTALVSTSVPFDGAKGDFTAWELSIGLRF